MIYVDTSSALKTLLVEEGSERVRELFRATVAEGAALVSSRLMRTEMYRIAHRESLDLDDVEKVLAYIHLVDVTRALLDAAAALPFHVRTLDAVHLATAQHLAEGSDQVRLLTDDAQMRRVGEELGIAAL